MHSIPSGGNLPGVEGGVVLAFPCPGCGRWGRPILEPCGCYVCPVCRRHAPTFLLEVCYRATRAFMPLTRSHG